MLVRRAASSFMKWAAFSVSRAFFTSSGVEGTAVGLAGAHSPLSSSSPFWGGLSGGITLLRTAERNPSTVWVVVSAMVLLGSLLGGRHAQVLLGVLDGRVGAQLLEQRAVGRGGQLAHQ